MSDDYAAGCGCCGRCCTFIITSGLTALFIWLSLRTSKPECSVQEFYLPALNTSDNSSSATKNNHTISFRLQLKNVMKDKGIFYDDLNLTFFYGSDSTHLIGNYTVAGFRQGHHKKAQKRGVVDTDGVPWQEAYTAALNKSGGGAVFRVDLATKIRYRIMFWHSKRHELVVGANVNVGDLGVKTNKKGIKMKSGVTGQRCYNTLLLVLFHLLVLLLLLKG